MSESSAALDHIGAIDLLDVDVIGEYFGRSFMPYPFMYTRPSRFNSAVEAAEYERSVPDRFLNGDLMFFRTAAETYAFADIRVECRMQFMPPQTPSVRAVAWRRSELGFMAAQRDDSDVIDVYSVSPYELGLVVGDLVWLSEPGYRQDVVIPEFVTRPRAVFDDGLAVRDVATSTRTTPIALSELTAYCTIQSHWRPAEKWGADPYKETLVLFSVYDDGDYVYEPGYAVAQPLHATALSRRIDELIADDVAILRELRRDQESEIQSERNLSGHR